jgi:hypothetical protein
LHSITKILRNGPKAHFPFRDLLGPLSPLREGGKRWPPLVLAGEILLEGVFPVRRKTVLRMKTLILLILMLHLLGVSACTKPL